MIKQFLFVAFIFSALHTGAQSGIFNRANQSMKNKTNQKLDQKVNNVIDQSLNSVDAGISGQNGKPAASGNESKPENNTSNGKNDSVPVNLAFRANSKFDFIPGEKIIVAEDFSQDAVGDFPDKWNTNSSGEVVTLEGKKEKWLALRKPGLFYPEYISSLPENFTLEFDVAASPHYSPSSASFELNIVKAGPDEMKAILYNSNDRFRITENTYGISLRIHPNENGNGRGGTYQYRTFENRSELISYSGLQTSFTNTDNISHISIWKQKSRIRMYINQEKVIDLAKAMNGVYNKIIFSPYYSYGNDADMLFLANLRLAVGDADTRNKLITEGKFVTHGIFFETGSDKIGSQSYAVLKEIAAVLTANSGVKIKIVGHTDTDGTAAGNLVLSKKRADAVKSLLAGSFEIAPERMTTEGKGQAEPLDTNNTATGRANNRRVEFIKE